MQKRLGFFLHRICLAHTPKRRCHLIYKITQRTFNSGRIAEIGKDITMQCRAKYKSLFKEDEAKWLWNLIRIFSTILFWRSWTHLFWTKSTSTNSYSKTVHHHFNKDFFTARVELFARIEDNISHRQNDKWILFLIYSRNLSSINRNHKINCIYTRQLFVFFQTKDKLSWDNMFL